MVTKGYARSADYEDQTVKQQIATVQRTGGALFAWEARTAAAKAMTKRLAILLGGLFGLGVEGRQAPS